MKLKIMILSNEHSWTYNLRKELIEKLLEEGYGVVLVLPYGERIDYFTALGCEFEDVPMFSGKGTNPIKDLSLLNAYRRLIRKHRPAAVISYTIKPNVYGGMACRMTHTPFIANITGLPHSVTDGGVMQFITTTLFRFGLKNASCVFFQNEANKNLFTLKKIVRNNTGILPGSGVSLSSHPYEDYPSCDETTKFIFIGRVMKDKGINEFIEAAEAIHKKHPRTSFDIVGRCDEDFSSVLATSSENGYISYHGQQSDVHSFIKRTHCTVLPSYHEGMANVLLESASCGRPVIATDIPGCRETFDEGVSGFSCVAQSTDSLIEAIEKFLALSYEERKTMGLAGRAKMEREFDRTIVVNALLGEIEKIIKENQNKQ